MLHRFVVNEVEEQEEIAEVDDGLVSQELMSFMTLREMSTQWMKTAISFLSLLKRMMRPPRIKMNKNRKIETNQYRY